MTLKRKLAGFSFALVSVLALVIGLLSRWITVTDISAAIAFTLVGAIFAALYWGWKPEIHRLLGGGYQPKLTIALTELKPEEKIQEVHVRFPNGEVIRHEARFCYVTVRNFGRRTAEDVVAYCDREQMVFMPIRRKSTYTADYRSPDDFDELLKRSQEEAYVFALHWDDKPKETINIRPDPMGESFVLF